MVKRWAIFERTWWPCWCGLLILAGCGDGQDNVNLYEKAKTAQADSATALEKAGGKASLVHYPLGDAWSVNLSGATITDELIAHLQKVGNIGELNFSKSTLTDAHCTKLGELKLDTVLVKLDLSHTAVTDAGLDKLTNSLFLLELNVSGTKVTPAGITSFQQKRAANPAVKAAFKTAKVIM